MNISTWEPNPKDGFFVDPLTLENARSLGWRLEMQCGQPGAPGFVFSDGGDLSHMGQNRYFKKNSKIRKTSKTSKILFCQKSRIFLI